MVDKAVGLLCKTCKYKMATVELKTVGIWANGYFCPNVYQLHVYIDLMENRPQTK